jgi:hypothetical protein
MYRGDPYLIFNDNLEVINPSASGRRDMYIARLYYNKGKFSVGPSQIMIHEHQYNVRLWQKNWVPFEWHHSLLFGYTINPHEVLVANLGTGICQSTGATYASLPWTAGEPRGGTPALLVDGEYLAFFHSSLQHVSSISNGRSLWHYYMGAYTFSAEPPFEIKKISSTPINGKDFYTVSNYEKRVIFPGGYAVVDDKIYVAYGKDDCEVWIAILDKRQLKESLVRVR